MEMDSGLRKVASALYCHLNTPKALACEIMLRSKEFGQLVAMTTSPTHYLDNLVGAEQYRRDAQATDFLRKSPLVPLKGIDLKLQAIDTFQECERQCHSTNSMLRDMLRSPGIGEEPFQERLRLILGRAEKIASRVLGKVPDELPGAFGPGTSFEMKGQTYTTVADKLWTKPHATDSALALFEHDFWRTSWGRTRLGLGLPLPEKIRGNRFTTVPKDALKLRGICVEPLGNLWTQLGAGRYLKRRLAAVGIKVDRTSSPQCPLLRLKTKPNPDGQVLHRRLAREGSVTGKWATIDLSNASDTMALELVRWVLPPEWYDVLSSLRSPYTRVTYPRLARKYRDSLAKFAKTLDRPARRLFLNRIKTITGGSTWVRLEKFSSMGNGATFELESLVFLSLLAAGCDLTIGRDLFVYGDDIILPNEKAVEAMAILRAVGFTPNPRKSFHTGPFRESCGGDFFLGVDVRPVCSTGELSSPVEWVALHNNIQKRWPDATLALKRCVDAVPSMFRLFGPPSLEDVVFHDHTRQKWRVWSEDGAWWVATIKVQPRRIPLDRWGEEFTLTLAILGVPSTGVTPRDEIQGYLISKASVS